MRSYARRRLGTELRLLRTASGLSGEEVADSCGWDQSKISRIETAKVAVSRHDLRRLCGIYGVCATDVERLEALLIETRGPRWWVAYSDVLDAAYEELIALESQATEIRAANAGMILGLLQTRDYAAAVIGSGPMIPDPERADALVEIRMRRQRVLTGQNPARFRSVLADGALQCEIGGRGVLTRQLAHLLELGELPNIDIHVIPTSSTANAYNGGLTMFDFSGPHAPGVLFVEYHGGMLIKEEDRDLRRYRRHLDYLFANALSTDESRTLISARMRSL
ncbi:helix-turn-helix domain-containing protein [Embleya sp. NPDC056575]|uniref:helix-turn-helix domain-containing protein n=1 Tax=unclassified Embleya TaxID=2699296 RepID=UPI0036AB74CB